ncbi:MAG: nucleotide sugar dehydrogenase, partial [Pseudomonas sp.]
MKISVFGSGYVGLVQATVLAEVGHDVICMDVDEKKVKLLQQGHVSIFEPGLAAMVKENLEGGRLTFTYDEKLAVEHGEVLFIAVGTPSDEDGSADLKYVLSVGDAVARHRIDPVILVEKSTVPVGTGDTLRAHMEKALRIAGRHLEFDIVSNPEFLKEGSAVADCRRPDRIVIGCEREEVREVMRELYAPFNRNHDRIIFMDLRSAELTKYAANAMLATKISFINEMANLCERAGADINDVRRGIGHDARIGFPFLFPGTGYGGSCFEADETVFALNSPTVRAEPLRDLFQKPGSRLRGDTVDVLVPPDQEVLAFDLEKEQPTLARVKAVTRRPYRGKMVQLKTSMGRLLRVTADHPVVLHREGGLDVVPAERVTIGDRLLTLCALPALEQAPACLNLLELLQDTD